MARRCIRKHQRLGAAVRSGGGQLKGAATIGCRLCLFQVMDKRPPPWTSEWPPGAPGLALKGFIAHFPTIPRRRSLQGDELRALAFARTSISFKLFQNTRTLVEIVTGDGGRKPAVRGVDLPAPHDVRLAANGVPRKRGRRCVEIADASHVDERNRERRRMRQPDRAA